MNIKDAEQFSKIIFYGTIATSLVLSFYFWPNFLYVILVWVLAVPSALAIAFITGIILSMMGEEKLDDQDEEDEDLRAYVIAQEQLILSKSEVILGTFKDESIYEWIEIENPETKQPLKLWFDGTYNIDNADNFEPPENIWWALIQPGILYVEKDATA
jgi:hypothetical protein